MLENIAEYYKKADGKTKKKILGSISEKLVLGKGKVTTYKFTKPIQVILCASKVFKNSGTKKEVEFCLQIQSNTFKNKRLNEIKMTSCPVWLP